MKTYRIAVQDGLEPIKELLKSKGHEILPYDQAGKNADIAIMSGVDSTYEEMETAQCMIHNPEGSEVLLINATGLTPEQVLNYVEHNLCK
jgi:hypothetical protein